MLLGLIVQLWLVSVTTAMGELGFDMGLTNPYGGCKSTDDFINDFDKMRPYTNTARIFAASDCGGLSNIVPALEASNFTAFVGIWPADDIHFAAEVGALSLFLPRVSRERIRGIIVGSEAIFRNDLTPAQLAVKVQEVQQLLTILRDKNGEPYATVPVGIDETWNVLVEHPDAGHIIAASEIILTNAYSYWQGEPPQTMAASLFGDITSMLQKIEQVKQHRDYEFWIGETGWPTQGNRFAAAWPSVKVASRHWQEAICAMRAWGVNVLAFEYEDEPWKNEKIQTGVTEKHWGLFDAHGQLKYNLMCRFDAAAYS